MEEYEKPSSSAPQQYTGWLWARLYLTTRTGRRFVRQSRTWQIQLSVQRLATFLQRCMRVQTLNDTKFQQDWMTWCSKCHLQIPIPQQTEMPSSDLACVPIATRTRSIRRWVKLQWELSPNVECTSQSCQQLRLWLHCKGPEPSTQSQLDWALDSLWHTP